MCRPFTVITACLVLITAGLAAAADENKTFNAFTKFQNDSYGYNSLLGPYRRIDCKVSVIGARVEIDSCPIINSTTNEIFSVLRTIRSSNGGRSWNIISNSVMVRLSRAEVYRVSNIYSYWVFKLHTRALFMSIDEYMGTAKIWLVVNTENFNYISCLSKIITDDKDCPSALLCTERQYDILLPYNQRNFDLSFFKMMALSASMLIKDKHNSTQPPPPPPPTTTLPPPTTVLPPVDNTTTTTTTTVVPPTDEPVTDDEIIEGGATF